MMPNKKNEALTCRIPVSGRVTVYSDGRLEASYDFEEIDAAGLTRFILQGLGIDFDATCVPSP